MRLFNFFILLIFSFNLINAQTKKVTEEYELHIKDQKILDAFPICFRNFDNNIKNYKHCVFKVFLTYYSPDNLEMIIDYYSPKDTIQYTQPDYYFMYEDKIAFVYNGVNLLTKKDDPDFHQFILNVCREKLEFRNTNKSRISKPIETKEIKNLSAPDTPLSENFTKVYQSDTKGMEHVSVVSVDPVSPILKYSIRKRKDKVEITALKSTII